MDLLTHAALGAGCAHLILGRKQHNIAWKVGALAAISPDLDLLTHYLSADPLSIEYWHRNFTHSLIFIPIAALLVSLILMIVPSFRKNWRITYLAALIGVATHGVLDACTSYGTLLLWPWSMARISWDIIAIIDPLFTIILVLGASWSIIHHERKAASACLLLACSLLLFKTYQHQTALNSVAAYAKQQQLTLTRIRVMPNLGDSTTWRVIAAQQNCFFVANLSMPWLHPIMLQSIINVPRFSLVQINSSLSPAQKKDIEIFSWFSDDYVLLANKIPLILADGRYTAGDRYPITSLWGIELLPNSAITRQRIIPINQHCTP